MGELRLNEGASLRLNVPEGYPPEIQAKAVEITELYTMPEKRGQGFARALLAETLKEADAAGKALLVHCEPSDLQTDSVRLQSMYASLGFIVFQREPLLMCRPPNVRNQ